MIIRNADNFFFVYCIQAYKPMSQTYPFITFTSKFIVLIGIAIRRDGSQMPCLDLQKIDRV